MFVAGVAFKGGLGRLSRMGVTMPTRRSRSASWARWPAMREDIPGQHPIAEEGGADPAVAEEGEDNASGAASDATNLRGATVFGYSLHSEDGEEPAEAAAPAAVAAEGPAAPR